MTCDDSRIHLLREIGGDADSEDAADAREHRSTCPACAGDRRDAHALWRLAGRAVETCPPRRSPLAVSGRGKTPSAFAAVAASLIVAASLLAWWARPGPGGMPGQDSDANAEELLRKDPELRKQVLRTAVQEKERLAEFEKKVSEAEKGFAEAKTLLDAKKFKETAERAEALLRSFPSLRLVVLDPAEPQFRSTLLRLRIR
ncbi:MAG TPA: hypothetical protein VG457_09360, partial [Planctomycetota bacterium]|nr:hypothetical protein [Planctomycetota bacterium]